MSTSKVSAVMGVTVAGAVSTHQVALVDVGRGLLMWICAPSGETARTVADSLTVSIPFRGLDGFEDAVMVFDHPRFVVLELLTKVPAFEALEIMLEVPVDALEGRDNFREFSWAGLEPMFSCWPPVGK